VKKVTLSCCGTKNKKGAVEEEMEIPEQVQKELDALGGDLKHLQGEFQRGRNWKERAGFIMHSPILCGSRSSTFSATSLSVYASSTGSCTCRVQTLLPPEYLKRKWPDRRKVSWQLDHLFADRYRAGTYPVIDPFLIHPGTAVVIFRITGAMSSLIL